MKNLTKITLVATSLAAAIPFLSNAAPTEGPTSSSPAAMTAPATGQPGQHPLMHRRRALQRRIARKLNLSPDQISQIKSIRMSTRETLKGIRANTSLTPDQKKAQAREAIQSARTQMHGLLTPEQQAKLAEIKARIQERLGGF